MTRRLGRPLRSGRPQTAALLPLFLPLLLTLPGCSDPIPNAHTDDRFIRISQTERQDDAPGSLGSGPLLPAPPGAQWKTRLTVRPMTASADGGAPQPPRSFTATVTLSPAGQGIARLVTHQPGGSASSAPLFSSSYRTGADGVSLTELNITGHTVTFTPPQPIIRTPVREGAVLRWQGTLHDGHQNLPAVGYSRVSYVDRLPLPSGSQRNAYRVDTVFQLQTNGAQQVSYAMSRWFAPGVGLVQQRFQNGNAEITQTLLSAPSPDR